MSTLFNVLYLSDSGKNFTQPANSGETKEALSTASNERCFSHIENLFFYLATIVHLILFLC